MPKKPICAITCHFNPCNFQRPRENFVHFVEAFSTSKIPLYLIELVFTEQEERYSVSRFPVRFANKFLQQHTLVDVIRERGLMFQKEALLNNLIKRLVDEYDAIAWIDGDVLFTNPRWPQMTLNTLENFPVVQLFSQAHLQDRTGEIAITTKSVGWYFSTRDERWTDFNKCHPGFAWAARSDILKKTGGLYPYAITGCGDTLMLQGWSHYMSPRVCNLFAGLHLRRSLEEWVYSAQCYDDESVMDNMSFIMGDVVHLWHGELRERQNAERMEWLRELNPEMDLIMRPDGVLEWSDFALKNKQRFVQGIAGYFKSRDEDGQCTLPS